MTQFSKKIKLTNGLSVIYEKNDNANIVSLQLGVRVGSAHEADHESGICHLIEHMVFKGSTSFKAGEIATVVESHGGELNAYTSLDQTAYYINLPSKHLSLGLKILKEMVFDASFDAMELEREKEVVVEEIRRGQDSPQRVLSELLFSNFYKAHPYKRPVIGTEKLVRGFSRDKIVGFYKKHYAPQNMILAVCGNVTENQLSKELENLFRFELSAPGQNHSLPVEPAQTKSRVIKKAMNINATYFDLAFAAPALSHDDVPALDLLSHLLGEADTSLLEMNTKEKEGLVHSIYSGCFTPRYPGIFIIGGLVDPKKINAALSSVRRQIEFFKTQLIEDEKIERAKLLARSQLVYEQQTCEGTARKWITFETTLGDYRYDQKYIEKISKLTSSHVQKVANKYLDFTKALLVILHSDKADIKIDRSIFQKTVSSISKNSFRKVKSKKDTSLYRLSNGLRVILKENHRLPLISMKTTSFGGLNSETPTNNGIHHLLSNIVTRSTESLNQEQLSEKIEWLAGGLSGYTGRNTFGLSYSFLSEKFHQALPLFGEVLLRPRFDESEIKKEKDLQLEAIRNRSDNPGQNVFRLTMGALYKGHPFRQHILGEKASVKKLTVSQLKSTYKNIITPKNLVVSAVGDFETDKMLAQLEDLFGSMKGANYQRKKISAPKKPNKPIRLFEVQEKQQAHIALGFLAPSLNSPDRYALDLLNNILSGQGGRLFLELRDKLSLAYTVTSTMIQGLETGFFGVYIGTEPGKVNQAISEIFKQLDLLIQNPVSKNELDGSKNHIIGNHEIDHQKNGAIAMQLALSELYGKSLDDFYEYEKQISKVTASQIQKAAKKYIELNRYVLGVVGPKGCFKA